MPYAGGLNVLDLARTGADVQAVVSMHGTLATPQPAQRGEIKAAVLAVHGAADPIAPKAERDAFEARRRTRLVREALEKLKPSEREALVMRFVADLSHREIAVACGLDEAAARKRTSRALARLRSIVPTEEIE